MQEAIGSHRQAPSNYVSKFTLYISPQGTLLLVKGNQSLQVSPDVARELLEFELQYASQFCNGNGQSHAE